MKKIRTILVGIIFLCAVFAVMPVKAEAATLKKLKFGKVYTAYDVNADGKADQLKVTRAFDSELGGCRLKIYINGKRKKSLEGRGFGDVFYYSKGKSEEYIIVQWAYMGGASDYTVFHASKTKLKKIGTIPAAYYSEGLAKSGSYLTCKTSPKYEFGVYLGDSLTIPVKVNVKDGKISLVKETVSVKYEPEAVIKASSAFYLYSDYKGRMYSGVFVPAGTRITFTKAHINKSGGYYFFYYKVSTPYGSGWLNYESANLTT